MGGDCVYFVDCTRVNAIQKSEWGKNCVDFRMTAENRSTLISNDGNVAGAELRQR